VELLRQLRTPDDDLVDVVTSRGYCDHMDVGVRELKQHLSAYLERAASGESIRVTDRGVPKALLMPLPDVDRVEQGIAEGWISPPVQNGFEPFQPRTAQRTVADVLGEDRDE
jgi:prevent-host-death family protein